MSSDTELHSRTKEFASQLSQTITEFTGEPALFTAVLLEPRVGVEGPTGGIPLKVGGETHLVLVLEMRCVWDMAGCFLAIEESKISVYPGTEARGEPLFRYDYVREPVGGIPCAHLQVHAHRDAFTHALCCAGRGSKRGKRTGTRPVDRPPHLQDVHFPLGGARFRPCVEDILAFLKLEFGLDAADGWERSLMAGRRRWREHQVKAAVRDAPEAAAEALRQLGFNVTGSSSVRGEGRLLQL